MEMTDARPDGVFSRYRTVIAKLGAFHHIIWIQTKPSHNTEKKRSAVVLFRNFRTLFAYIAPLESTCYLLERPFELKVNRKRIESELRYRYRHWYYIVYCID